MEFRAVTRSNTLWVTLDGLLYIWSEPIDLLSGQPGIGARGTPAGNSIASVSLGVLDRIAPGNIPRTTISSTAFPTQVDIRWQPPADDANGTGIWGIISTATERG